MGVAYNSKIVTDGLQLCLDAGNLKSYPTTGLTWTDLSGNGRNGTLSATSIGYNSANGGSLVFDGADDYVQCSGSITTSTATFIVWIRRNGDQSASKGIIFSRSSSANGLNVGPASNLLGYTWSDSSVTYNWNSGLTLPNLSWSMCAVSIASSAATAYLYQASGLTTATNNASHFNNTLDDIKIGQDEFGGRYFNGNIAQVSIYNRALTATEIQQNYLATKSRYFS